MCTSHGSHNFSVTPVALCNRFSWTERSDGLLTASILFGIAANGANSEREHLFERSNERPKRSLGETSVENF